MMIAEKKARYEVSKTIRIDKALEDRAFKIMQNMDAGDVTFSDIVRDALTLYFQVLRFAEKQITPNTTNSQ